MPDNDFSFALTQENNIYDFVDQQAFNLFNFTTFRVTSASKIHHVQRVVMGLDGRPTDSSKVMGHYFQYF